MHHHCIMTMEQKHYNSIMFASTLHHRRIKAASQMRLSCIRGAFKLHEVIFGTTIHNNHLSLVLAAGGWTPSSSKSQVWQHLAQSLTGWQTFHMPGMCSSGRERWKGTPHLPTQGSSLGGTQCKSQEHGHARMQPCSPSCLATSLHQGCCASGRASTLILWGRLHATTLTASESANLPLVMCTISIRHASCLHHVCIIITLFVHQSQ